MARPKSEDKKQALLEAATQAIAQSGIAASTAVIARNAGVAEGTLFRYFATKDELINTLYLHLKQDLCQSMIMELDRSITDAKMMTRFIWNSYISWGLNHPARHRAIRQLAVSEKLTKETEQRADDMFPELRDLCHRSVLMVFMSDESTAPSATAFFWRWLKQQWISPRAIPLALANILRWDSKPCGAR